MVLSWLCVTCDVAGAGETKEVWSLFEEMRAGLHGASPLLESFTIMLELCAREGGRSEEALQLMEQLEAAGTDGTHSTRTPQPELASDCKVGHRCQYCGSLSHIQSAGRACVPVYVWDGGRAAAGHHLPERGHGGGA